jgi:lipopolysaccharide export LptBFGC system permease protein LptF
VVSLRRLGYRLEDDRIMLFKLIISFFVVVILLFDETTRPTTSKEARKITAKAQYNSRSLFPSLAVVVVDC